MSRSPTHVRCPLTGRRAVLAPERAARPMTLDHSAPHPRDQDGRAVCPFCEGMEHDTPNEVFAVRAPGTSPDQRGWKIRVVPNRFPAVRPDAADGFGVHELVVACPHHETNPARLPVEHLALLFTTFRHRLQALGRDDRLAFAQAFVNVGAEAGASLAHLHAQIIATPFVPDTPVAERAAASRHFEATGRCGFCDLAKADAIVANDRFAAVSPVAPRFECETWVLPTAHASRFETLTDEDALALADVLRRVLAAIDAELADPAYNLVLRTAPLRAAESPAHHWYLEVLPRTSRFAGFEWGTGVFVNPLPPAAATAALRARVAGKL